MVPTQTDYVSEYFEEWIDDAWGAPAHGERSAIAQSLLAAFFAN
jgi:hypothetical protein